MEKEEKIYHLYLMMGYLASDSARLFMDRQVNYVPLKNVEFDPAYQSYTMAVSSQILFKVAVTMAQIWQGYQPDGKEFPDGCSLADLRRSNVHKMRATLMIDFENGWENEVDAVVTAEQAAMMQGSQRDLRQVRMAAEAGVEYAGNACDAVLRELAEGCPEALTEEARQAQCDALIETSHIINNSFNEAFNTQAKRGRKKDLTGGFGDYLLGVTVSTLQNMMTLASTGISDPEAGYNVSTKRLAGAILMHMDMVMPSYGMPETFPAATPAAVQTRELLTVMEVLNSHVLNGKICAMAKKLFTQEEKRDVTFDMQFVATHNVSSAFAKMHKDMRQLAQGYDHSARALDYTQFKDIDAQQRLSAAKMHLQ